MKRVGVLLLLTVALAGAPTLGNAALTLEQVCESAAEKASAGYAKCRLDTEAKAALGIFVGQGLIAAFEKCSVKFSDAFSKAVARYGAGNCPTTPARDFREYLTQCSDDVATAAAGGGLPDCVGDLDACTTDLGAAQADLAAAQAQLVAWAASLPHADNADGTITDWSTGLMWEKHCDDESIHDWQNSYTWGDATAVKVAALNSASYAGHNDWRLPTKEELESIINSNYYFPAVSPVFNTGCGVGCTVTTCSCTRVSNYWSSSTWADNSALAWAVDFYGGTTLPGYKTIPSYVRAVRVAS